MGIFPALWTIWLYTALFALLAVLCVVGIRGSRRPRIRVALGVGCVVALVALASAFLTGFTFRLNAAAPDAPDRMVYLVPNCLCLPDSTVPTDLDAMRVRDGQVPWRHPFQSGGLGPSDAFTSDDQRVYLAHPVPGQGADIVTALDALSGRQDWQVTTTSIGGILVGVFQGRLVLSSLEATVVLDAATGAVLAQVPVGNAVFEEQGVVYSCLGLNNVVTITATDEATAGLLWTSPNVFGCGLATTPTVIIASGQDMVSALRVSDGSLLWRATKGMGSSTPVILGDTVFTSIPTTPDATGQQGVVKARRMSDGSLLWQRTLGGASEVNGVADGVVLADTGAEIVALGASDGRRLWSFSEAGGSPSVATMKDGVVFLKYASSTQIVALNLHNGTIYWQTTL